MSAPSNSSSEADRQLPAIGQTGMVVGEFHDGLSDRMPGPWRADDNGNAACRFLHRDRREALSVGTRPGPMYLVNSRAR